MKQARCEKEAESGFHISPASMHFNHMRFIHFRAINSDKGVLYL